MQFTIIELTNYSNYSIFEYRCKFLELLVSNKLNSHLTNTNGRIPTD